MGDGLKQDKAKQTKLVVPKPNASKSVLPELVVPRPNKIS